MATQTNISEKRKGTDRKRRECKQTPSKTTIITSITFGSGLWKEMRVPN